MKWPRVATVVLLALVLGAPLAAQVAPPPAAQTTSDAGQKDDAKNKRGDIIADTPDTSTQIQQLEHALVRLPIAAALACLLAMRPRRRGTPPKQAPVIHTQIILAVVGAVVMLVVGSSLARAFGIVGAAGLVRYRAQVQNPKDAGVMLSTLSIGLASGVGLWPLAIFATVFVLGLLWLVESFEPRATQLFALKVKTKDPAAIKPKLDQLLARQHVEHELRATSKEDLSYDVQWPIDRGTERISDQIIALDPDAAVQWEEKKEKK
jgi:uncharacterized membrane protein YhiD involved in acid resistance